MGATMADNAEVMAGIARQPGVRYSVLTPNLQGFEAAAQSRPDEIVVFGAASEAFSQKNINCSIADSIERFRPVAQAALAKGLTVRGAISCAEGCPYEGEIAPERVAMVALLMHGIGVQHVSVADTIPNLAGQKAAYLESQLRALKSGGRRNAVMNAVAGQLSPQEISNVAAYFSSLPGATVAST